MRKFFTLLLVTISLYAKAQLLSWSPSFVRETSDPVEIIMDATKGNQGLKDYASTTDVYVHIGVITTSSTSAANWRYIKFGNFNAPSPLVQCTYVSPNKWKFTITGGLRSFFGLTTPTEKIQKIAILFRNGAGSKVQRNADASDMYIPVYDDGYYVRIDQPFREPKYAPTAETITKTLGDNISMAAAASQSSTLKLYLNGSQVGTTAISATQVSATATISSYGTQTIVAEGVNGAAVTKRDTITFFVTPPTPVAALPSNVNDGINYEPGDTSVTLVLFAPFKSRVAVIGDFNNWTETSAYQMNRTPDSSRYWLRITGLTPGSEYGYQFLIDGSLKVADYLTEKVLDPDNDKYISSVTYPNLKAYPAGKTSGIVSILQTAKPQYNWQVSSFSKPDKRNLVIYELLVRDFVATQNWQTVKDSISYLKKLGINAIEVMPFNEFEGNNSWGYNPNFYLAPDKAYGTETALKQFIDECHKQGIAVIMDMVLNHSFGSSPMVQMYFDGSKNVPAANNPWFNQYPTHAFNVGYQFNHESVATKAFRNRVIQHWLTNYHVDGYRFDLAKGFTQTKTCDATGGNCNVGTWGNYDQSRVNIWDSIFTFQRSVDSTSYCILEMFADNSEETVYANKGMILWGNLNYNFNQATMGYTDQWDLTWGLYTARNWNQPGLVTYQESHDEERLMYKNEQYGNSSGSYNVKDINTGLKRNEMATAFWAMMPGPKMLWQFGELGYDYSINRCENGTINNDCRVSPKPLAWNYLANPNRVALHDAYARLLNLRAVPAYRSAFTTPAVVSNLGSAFKTLKINSDSLRIMVIGNFDVVPKTETVTFQNAGLWYSYLTGTTRVASGSGESITLQPGEYYVYVNRNADSAVNVLPEFKTTVKAMLQQSSVAVQWSVTDPGIKVFDIERSYDGVTFSHLATVNSRANNVSLPYLFTDNTAFALSSTTVYYRIRLKDADGRFTYTPVVSANLSTGSPLVFPNPAAGGKLYIKPGATLGGLPVVSLYDLGGRMVRQVKSSGSLIQIDTHGLAPGTYTVRITSAAQTSVQKIVIAR